MVGAAMRWTRAAGALAVAIVGLAAAGLLAFTPATARAAETAISTGNLEVVVSDDPFSIEFRDTKSGEVLRTLGGPLPDPQDPEGRYGPLGYSFDLRVPVLNNAYFGYYAAGEGETVWFHATRATSIARSGSALVIEAASNDPLGSNPADPGGHAMVITIEIVAPGVVRVNSDLTGPFADQASLSGAAFEAAEEERYLGLGSRSNAVDQTGTEVFNWAEEGPFSAGEYEDFFAANLPDFTFPTGPTATNFPVPWTVLSRGLGFLIDQTWRSRFRFVSERDDAWQAEAETDFFQFMVFAGPDPATVVRRYSAYTGRQPDPRPWIFGPWFQATLEDRPYEVADLFRVEDVPVTVSQTYTHYLPCGSHVGRLESERERVVGHHDRGYKITTYFNPHVCTSYQPVYDDLAARSLLVENAAGEPYTLSNPFTADQVIAEFDFSNPEANAAFGTLLDEAIGVGYDGWMEDFGEYTPTDSFFDNGKGGLEMHNLYPVLYHGASYEHTSRPDRMGRDAAIFVRSGWHGSQPVSRVVWGGDPTEDWSCTDGVCSALFQAINMGLSGFAYQGSDIGGFHAVVNDRTDDELNIRWLQVGAISGVMRTQANGFSFGDDRASRSQVWHQDVLPIWRIYSKLRTQLLPYIQAASDHYQRKGMPLARHLALAFPDDPKAIAAEKELMFGPDLFVAPVLEPGASERSFYLPKGRWVDFWRSVQFKQKRGVFRPDGATLVKGGRRVTLPAPLEEMPMLARAGTILPLLSADVDTLANVASGPYPEIPEEGATSRARDPIPGKRDPGLVELRDRRDRMRLLGFPRGRSTAAIGPGEKLVSKERSGRRWQLEIRGKRRRTYFLRISTASLKRPFAPCELRLDGERLGPGKWGYTAKRDVLRARVKVRTGTLRAGGRC